MVTVRQGCADQNDRIARKRRIGPLFTIAGHFRQRPHRGGTRLFLLRSPAMVFYMIGTVASATKNTAISTFLMIFYNQVVGLPALTVSAILMVAMICDAFFDPLVGHISDNWRSSLGRRLPLMYLSVIPLTICFILLWMPPEGWSPIALHIYLAVNLLGVRLFDTFFELPHLALVPELSSDYHQRTRIFTIRSLCESAGGLAISLLAYNVFMKEAADGSGGILSGHGYTAFALFCGVTIFASIWACAAGLRRWGLGKPDGVTLLSAAADTEETLSSARIFRGVAGHSSLVALIAAMMLIAVASGTGGALGIYWMLYFFRFSQAEITLLSLPAMLGFIVVALLPAITRRLGKRDAAIILCWLYGFAGAIPMLARMANWVAADSPLLFAMVAAQCFLGPASIIMVFTCFSSMAADLVEVVQIHTGRRSEGLLLSSISFSRKLMAGAGTLVAGLILTAVSFPQGAERGQVPPTVMTEMIGIYLAIKALLFLAATVMLLRYRHSLASHENSLRTLSIGR